jgi:hypothetical protein
MAGYAPDGYARWGGDPGWDGADSDQPERRPTVTPFRVVMLIALIASAFVASYGLFIARASQVIPITVAALAVFAIAAALLGINVGASSLSSARSGRLGRSIIGALVGGILCLMAAGAGAAAIMMGLLAGPLN